MLIRYFGDCIIQNYNQQMQIYNSHFMIITTSDTIENTENSEVVQI